MAAPLKFDTTVRQFIPITSRPSCELAELLLPPLTTTTLLQACLHISAWLKLGDPLCEEN